MLQTLSSKTTLTFCKHSHLCIPRFFVPGFETRSYSGRIGLFSLKIKAMKNFLSTINTRHVNSFKFKGISSPSHKINLNCFLSLWLDVLCWKNFDCSVQNLIDARGNFTQGEIDTVWGINSLRSLLCSLAKKQSLRRSASPFFRLLDLAISNCNCARNLGLIRFHLWYFFIRMYFIASGVKFKFFGLTPPQIQRNRFS